MGRGHRCATPLREIENLEHETTQAVETLLHADDLTRRFEDVAALLAKLNVSDLWDYATETERRTLLDELLQDITVHPDRLSVTVHEAPPLNVAFSEVGLKDSELNGVGGGT